MFVVLLGIEAIPVCHAAGKPIILKYAEHNPKYARTEAILWWIDQVVLKCGENAVKVENTCNPWANKVVYGFTEDQIFGNFVNATHYEESAITAAEESRPISDQWERRNTAGKWSGFRPDMFPRNRSKELAKIVS